MVGEVDKLRPRRDVDGLNLYVYGRSNPLRKSDKSGRQAVDEVARETITFDDLVSEYAANAAVDVLQEMIQKHRTDIKKEGISKYGGTQYSGSKSVEIPCGCLTFPEKAVETYFTSAAGFYRFAARVFAIPSEAIAFFPMTRSEFLAKGPGIEYLADIRDAASAEAQDAASTYQDIMDAYKESGKRGTALLRALHEHADWTTVYFANEGGIGIGRFEAVSTENLYPAGNTPEAYQTPIDYYIRNLHNSSERSTTSQENLDRLNNVRFAIGVVNSGRHTFVLSSGMVYEVHWGKGPSDPQLFEVSNLEEFMESWESGVVAIPAGLLKAQRIEFNR